MTIEAKIIADSISLEGKRITTMQLRYPRFVHAEFMTHRMFSRNASSSRAIPVEKLIADIKRDPAMPVFWGSNQPGMQADEELDEASIQNCKEDWLQGLRRAVATAEDLMGWGLHKQIANRVLEPWAHINVVVTATEWENFYELRCHPDAQPEMQALAVAMRVAQMESNPKTLRPREWHLPYADRDEDYDAAVKFADGCPEAGPTDEHIDRLMIGASVARCARVSYLTHEGKEPDMKADIDLYARLVGGVPLHASPAEHQATPDTTYGIHDVGGLDNSQVRKWKFPELHGNLSGWVQYRKQLEIAQL